VARAIVTPGSGTFTVNGSPVNDYLMRDSLIQHAQAPLEESEMMGKVDIRATAKGGGTAGQAGAIRLAISRALVEMSPELKSTMRKNGFLTRDSRKVERKKYGRPKARKRFQYSKR
jgi:small subunit ribosomal protein S9